MNLFNTVALEINSRCNRKCEFCPVAYNHRPEEQMDRELYTKALNELGDMNYTGRIELYIYNEPCRDMSHLLWCLTKARDTAPKACLMIATNGDYIKSAQQIIDLYKAGLNQLLINCYSPNLYERRLKLISEVEELDPSVRQENRMYSRVSPYHNYIWMLDKSDPAQFGSGVFRLVNRAGNIQPFLPALQTPVERMCVKPFRLLNINWRGEALVCCQDYHGHVSFGNLRQMSLTQLWEHPIMNEYRHRLLKKDRSLPLCRQCDCHAGAYPHNVGLPTGPKAGAKCVNKLYQANLNKFNSMQESSNVN